MSQAFKLELRRCRALILWTTLAAVAYGAIMAWIWPIMRDNAEAFEQYMKIFPPELMAAFGMEGSLADPGIFFTTYIGGLLWPIMAALAGIVIATRPVAVDLERGFLELPLATGLSRARYLGAVICAHASALAVLAACTILGFWVAAQVVGAPFELGRMIVVALLAWLFACAIAACASGLAVITLSRSLAGGIVAVALLGMYLLNIIAAIEPNLSGLASLSVLHYFKPTQLIDHGTLPLAELVLFALIAVAAWTLALWSFRRRNLAA
jgi:hypothetical protein